MTPPGSTETPINLRLHLNGLINIAHRKLIQQIEAATETAELHEIARRLTCISTLLIPPPDGKMWHVTIKDDLV